MAETKDFTCRACGAQFDNRDTLDQHTRREHGAQGQGAGGSERYDEGATPRSGQQGTQGTGAQRPQGDQQGQQGQQGQGQRQQGQQGQPRPGDAGTPRREEGFGEGTQRGGMNDPREREKRADESSSFNEEG